MTSGHLRLPPLYAVLDEDVSRQAGWTLVDLAAACLSGGIRAELSPNIRREIWEKFVFLVALSGATTTMRTTIGPIRENQQTRQFLLDLMAEVVRVAVHSPAAAPLGPPNENASGVVPSDWSDASRVVVVASLVSSTVWVSPSTGLNPAFLLQATKPVKATRGRTKMVLGKRGI